MGYVDKGKDKIYVYNHVQLIVKYHETQNGARVVGIYAEPYSVRHKFAAGVQVPSISSESKNAALNSESVKTCTGYPMTRTDANFAGPQELIPGGQIIYTYDVVWEPSDVAWASRWDIYLNTGDETLNNVPFGASFVELYFVLDSLWMEAYYYLFGFAACGFILLVLAAAEVASLLTYYTLCAENHRWWWRAFLAPATTGLYVFGYAAYYYGAHLQEEAFDALQAGLFFGYMLLDPYR